MIFFFIIGLVNLSNIGGGGKNFETGVYSYNKFIKKNIWIHLQVLGIKKIGN